jgi:hypothetical protein
MLAGLESHCIGCLPFLDAGRRLPHHMGIFPIVAECRPDTRFSYSIPPVPAQKFVLS